MRDRIIVLTECGSDIGFGHVTRCAAIAEAFRSAGADAELWVVADGAARERLPLHARAVEWYDLSDGVAAELAQAAAVLIDSLIATAVQIGRIAQINSRLAVIDDWLRRAHEHGIVIDWTIGAEKFAYPEKNPSVRYLLGSEFCALRPEFVSAAPRTFSEMPLSVLITFGGADIRGLTGPVLTRLRTEFPLLHRHVVVGGAVRDRSFIDALRDEGTTFHFACDAAQMSALMAQTDFAICAGGQTLYELAALGLPPVVVRVIDNQTDDLREFGAVGFAVLAGDWDAADLLDRIMAGVRALHSASERQWRSRRGRACVDGRGGRRLALACLEYWSGSATATALCAG